MSALAIAGSVETSIAQTQAGIWKCYHSTYCDQGTAVDDYYAFNGWKPICKVIEPPRCELANDRTEICKGVCWWHTGITNQPLKIAAGGAAYLHCPPGTVARQGLCVAVPSQGDSCPITPGSAVDPLSGRSHRQVSDWTAGATAASRGISKSRVDAQSADEFRVDLTRYYSSKYESLNFPFSSRLGVGWRTGFDASVTMNASSLSSATLIHFILPNSAEYSFSKQLGLWKPVVSRLTSSGAVKWDRAGPQLGFVLTSANNQITLRQPDESEYVFNSVGRLIQVRMGSGYIQTLEYTGTQNTRVFDNLGGWVKFFYAHPTQPSLLTSVETSDGIQISYSYENRYLDNNGPKAAAEHSRYWTLKSVVYTDSASGVVEGSRDRYYEYLADRARPFLLTGVFDRTGSRLAGWTYDAKGRATSSEERGGANHWSYSYDELLGNVTVTNLMGLGIVYKFGIGSLGIRQLLAIDGSAVNGAVPVSGSPLSRISMVPRGQSSTTSQPSGSSQVCYEDCAEEIIACMRICRSASSDPNMPSIWAGAAGRCMKGCVSARCGGNKV